MHALSFPTFIDSIMIRSRTSEVGVPLTPINIRYSSCVQQHILEDHIFWGALGSVVIKALCCKPEGRGFKSR
jgi:hypothetical protein